MLDWMVDLATLDTRTEEKEEASRARVHALIAAWHERDQRWDLDDDVKKRKEPAPTGVIGTKDEKLSRQRNNSNNNLSETNLQLAPAVSRAVSDIMSIHAHSVGADKRPGWGKQTWILTRR